MEKSYPCFKYIYDSNFGLVITPWEQRIPVNQWRQVGGQAQVLEQPELRPGKGGGRAGGEVRTVQSTDSMHFK